MNTKNNLTHIHVSFWDLIQWHTEQQAWYEMTIARSSIKRPTDHHPGFYNQSSISDIVDEFRGIRTMGHCYTKPSFEIKLK